MRIDIFILFFLPVILLSCSKPERQGQYYGYIEFTKIDFSVDGEVIPLTRAVNAGLQIQIWQNGTLLPGRDYMPGADFSKRIVLPVGGGYQIKAFTPDQAEAGNDETGHPVYSVESESFRVVEADITTISLVAPQINTGVGVRYEASFLENFTDVAVTITSESGRIVTIPGSEDTELRYFKVPVTGKLQYTVKASNADGEIMEQTSELEVGAKNYIIKLSI